MKKMNKKFTIVAQEWLLTKKLSVKYSSYIKYETIVFTHLKGFAYQPINDITEQDIMNYFNKQITNKTYSLSTLKAIRYVLKSIFEYAHSKYDIPNINFKLMKLAKANTQCKILTKQQRELLETYCFQRTSNISLAIILSLYGGFRVGEMAGLKWEDIDFDNEVIHVQRTIERLKATESGQLKTRLMELEPKSITSKRTVPMPHFVMDYIKRYYHLYMPDHVSYFIYTNSDKISDPRNIQYHFEKTCSQLGFCLNYHTLRHTYATNCVMNNIDIKSLSEMLGHSSVTITLDLYVHSTLEFKKEQVNKIKMPTFIAEQSVLL